MDISRGWGVSNTLSDGKRDQNEPQVSLVSALDPKQAQVEEDKMSTQATDGLGSGSQGHTKITTIPWTCVLVKGDGSR